MVRGEHEVQVERAQQREHLARVAAVHADKNLIEQDDERDEVTAVQDRRI
jgi:hypothetical protein